MTHSDGLPEKANKVPSSKLLTKMGTKVLTNTKLQNAKHRITRNRQMERQSDRQICLHKNCSSGKQIQKGKHDSNVK